ncbi:hypothetical protein, partial [Chryseobacterium sp.]|uniref:hypothetical protein n=1 Tax=Chryseobacterium sp. TaxID=1871047 RepID=UPI002FCB0CDA
GIVSDELKKKWNTDNYEDVCFLEDEYDEWASNREVDDKAISDLVKEICYTKMELNAARYDKDNKLIGEKTKILQDLMGSANLKPVQDIGNASNDQVTFGTLIKKLENEEPIPEWETPDWVDELRIWTVGQLARMEGLKDSIVTDYVNKLEEYTISESEDEE